MPIPLPNLDDRTYDDLVAEAIAMIPTINSEWTNHNPSDPGIALVELLAWLTDMALFQVNQITDQHRLAFLELLNGQEWSLGGVKMETAVQQTVTALRQRHRAITQEDFAHLIFNEWPQTDEARGLPSQETITRFCCLPQCDLEGDPTAKAPAHISLIILTNMGKKQPEQALLDALFSFLDKRRLLAVKLRVKPPAYQKVTIQAEAYVREDTKPADALRIAKERLSTFFDPWRGGDDSKGWPFGRGVYASELYALLSRLPAINYVENVTISDASQVGSTTGVSLQKHELVEIDLSQLVVIDIFGNRLQASA